MDKSYLTQEEAFDDIEDIAFDLSGSGNIPEENTGKMQKRTKMGTKRKKKNIVDKILNVVLVCLFGGLILVGGSLFNYYHAAGKAEDAYGKLRKVVKKDSSEEKKELTLVDCGGKYVWDKYADAYMENHDFVGWIKIDDTPINYPVCLNEGKNDYYLHRAFDGSYSSSGTIFADNRSDMESLADNVTLYGHHMKTGTMFGCLEKYEDEDFLKKHKYITFDTITGHYVYEVVAAFRTSTSDNFKYADFYKESKEGEYNAFIKGIQNSAGVEFSTESRDKFLTLSTCAYHTKNGRFVVVARQIENSDDYKIIKK